MRIYGDKTVMQIIEFFECKDQSHWIDEIDKCDWRAGAFLRSLLLENRLKELCGESSRLLLLADGEKLVSFCTLAELDDIRDTDLTPWIGFVYTYPEYRGHRYVGRLLERACELAKEDGHKHVYISTNEDGLYEKYGFSFWKMMKDMEGSDSKVYKTDL